jgi:Fe2+ or Zn2+ uptake regulation protein
MSERRMTSQRRAVLEAVFSHGGHPTADEVFDIVRSRLPGTSLSTVYRNLGILVEQGEISAIHGPCSELHYDRRCLDHGHVHCSVCGSVSDVDVHRDGVADLAPIVASGYRIDNVYITFTGVCPACSRERMEEER